MKISCTPISFSASMHEGKNQEDYFRMIADAGAEASDILDNAAYPWFWSDYETELKDIKTRMQSFGLQLSAFATGNNFATKDPEKFQLMLNRVKDAICTAAFLDAPCLRIFGGYYGECGGEQGISYAEGLALVTRALDELVLFAERKGVVLALENHGRIPGLSHELEYFCNRYQTKSFMLTFDVANFVAHNMDETEDPLHAYSVLRNRIAHIHVKSFKPAPPDSERRSIATITGDGCIVPLRQFLYILQKDRYSGYCSLEYEAAKTIPESQGVPASLRKLVEMKQAAELIYHD